MAMQNFNIAFEKAAEVTKRLENRCNKDSFVPLNDIIQVVKEITNYSEIHVSRTSFSQLKLPENKSNASMPHFGAMLSTGSKKNQKTNLKEYFADLIINSDCSPDMQRFSVVHELGHLITQVPTYTYDVPNDGKYTISAHINPDITYIQEEDCKNKDYLIAEQIANIFALLVLIPQRVTIKDIKNDGIEHLTKKYGVTEDAIYSRMVLSNVSSPKNNGV